MADYHSRSVAALERSSIPEPNSGCWLWTGAASDRGYGILAVMGRRDYAHRLSYKTYRGPIPDGQYVLHRCDVPACINPDHLFVGTQFENMRDCVSKGRHASHNSATKYVRGERSHLAKLTAADIIAIRQLDGRIPFSRIASIFGVTKSSVTQIIGRDTWRHVPEITALLNPANHKHMEGVS